MKKTWVAIVAVSLAVLSSINVYAGWEQDNNGWRYRNPDGSYFVRGNFIEGNKEYVIRSGYLVRNKWVGSSQGVWVYVGEDGAILKSTHTPDGYLVDSKGAWIDDHGRVIISEDALEDYRNPVHNVDFGDQHSEPDSDIAFTGMQNKNGWVLEENGWKYYMNGTMLQNQWIEGNYYVGEDGVMLMLDASYQIPDFNTLFEKKDFDEIVGKGAFPLTPLSALLLLGLSERVAQNERTIFTFIASRDINSLAVKVHAADDSTYIGADVIYDYFSPLLEEEKDSDIHNEWLKTEYAITKTEDAEEQGVIKALSVIRIIDRRDDVPANEEFIHLALGISRELVKKALKGLEDKELIVFRKSEGAYDFQNRIGINVENEIADCIVKHFSKVNVPDTLNAINRNRFILPKKYNQDHFMTRFFEVRVVSANAFEQLGSFSALLDEATENKPDGFLLLVPRPDDFDETRFGQHIHQLKCSKNKDDYTEDVEKRITVAIIDSEDGCIELVKTLLAIQRLMLDESFIKENEVLEAELQSLKAYSIMSLNQWLTEQMNKLQGVFTYEGYSIIDKKGLNRTISELCEKIYYKTPIINHELINRHNVSAQVSKARNILMDDFLHGRSLEKYESGTSAESTIYRATIAHTVHDENLQSVREQIVSFIHESSKGEKVSFGKLIDKLTSAPIGMRRGPIPIYIMEELVKLYELADMPVVYQDKIEQSVDAQLIGNIVASPDRYVQKGMV